MPLSRHVKPLPVSEVVLSLGRRGSRRLARFSPRQKPQRRVGHALLITSYELLNNSADRETDGMCPRDVTLCPAFLDNTILLCPCRVSACASGSGSRSACAPAFYPAHVSHSRYPRLCGRAVVVRSPSMLACAMLWGLCDSVWEAR